MATATAQIEATATDSYITAKHVEQALDGAGIFDIYVLLNLDTNEIELDFMASGIRAPAWAAHIEEWGYVQGWEAGKAARAGKNAKAAMRRLLEACC